MAARFEPVRGLDEQIAVRIAQPHLRRVLDALTDEAQRRAPAVKVWVTMRDERVRRTHMDADGQAVPENLRFKIGKPDNPADYELGRHPRDQALSAGNAINCRCDDPHIPHLLRDTIHSTGVHVTGTVVHGEVETRFPRAGESEVGTSGDEAARFFGGALDEVALRLRAGRARG